MTSKYLYNFTLLLLSLLSIGTGEIHSAPRLEGDILYIDALTDSIAPFEFADNQILRTIIFEPRQSANFKIGEYAFMGCGNLREVILPNFVSELGEGCFKECQNLRLLAIPESVKSTPRYMAAWCDSLTEIRLPKFLKKIGAHSFAYCESLKEITLPQSKLATIENNAFSRCVSLKEIIIPESVTTLESYAFSDCTSLRRATLPPNDAMLGELIFSGCSSLTEILELSSVPPAFDCNSTLFEPDDAGAYERCRLLTQHGCTALYRDASGWRLFKTIEGTN